MLDYFGKLWVYFLYPSLLICFALCILNYLYMLTVAFFLFHILAAILSLALLARLFCFISSFVGTINPPTFLNGTSIF
ncbi:hypothetical protein LCGC14_3067740, partial [marine sediment metagenome]